MELSQVLQALRNADAAGDTEAARRLAQIARDLAAAQAESPAPEKAKAAPTTGGQVKEFFKGLAPGAIGMVESAAIGASALLPDEQERAARETIAGVAGAAKKPFEAAPGYEETVGRKFGQAVGSVAPFLALGPLGAAGRVGMAALGSGAGAGEARTRAEQEGGMDERGIATALGATVGVSEMFAPARILGRIAEPAKAGAVAFVKRALMAGGEEAAQEAAAQAAQNMIAKGLYKPEQEIIEQVGESAAYGGATGALVQGLLDLAIGRRAPSTTFPQRPAVTPETAPPTAPVAPTAAEEEAIAEPTLRMPIRETMRPPVVSEEEPTPELTPLQQYAARQIAQARANVEKPLNKDFLEALLADPAMAQQLVAERVALPGFDARRSEGLLGALELQLQKRAKDIGKAGKVGTAAAQQRLLGLEEEEQAALDAQRAEEERARQQATEEQKEAVREQKIAPEVAGIQRLGKITTPKGEYFRSKADELFRGLVQRGLDEKTVEDLVNTLPLGESYTPLGQVVYGAGVTAERTRRDLQAQFRAARMVRDRTGAREAVEALRALSTEEKAGVGAVTTEAAKALNEQFGIRAPENLAAERQAEKYADAQNAALIEMVGALTARDFGQRRPIGKLGLETAAAQSEKGRAAKVEQLRQQFLQAHLAELAARKEAFGLPPMLDWERGEAQARVNEALNELIERWGTFGAPTAAMRVLQEQTRQSITGLLNNAIDRDRQRQQKEVAEKTGAPTDKFFFQDAEGRAIPGKTMEVPRRPEGPRIAPPAELKLREQPRLPEGERETAMTMLDQVLSTAERRTRGKPVVTEKAPTKVKGLEGLGALFQKEKAGAVPEKLSPELVRFAQRLRDELEVNTDPEFAELARKTAQRIMEGNIPNAADVRELNEMMQERAKAAQSATRPGATPEELQRTSAAPQLSLFGEVATMRATPANFQRLLDSKDVQGLRDAIQRIKDGNKAALEQAKKYASSAQRDLREAIKELQKAKQRLKELQASADKANVSYGGIRAKEGEGKAVESAAGTGFEIRTETAEPEWFAPLVRQIVELESVVGNFPLVIGRLKELQKELKGLDKTAKKDLLQFAQLAGDKELVALLQRGALNREIAEVKTAYENAMAFIPVFREKLNALLTEWNKDSVIREALERELAKAERRVGRSEEKVRKATGVAAEERKAEEAAQAAEAEKIVTPEAKWRASLQRGREGLNLPGLRVERDTTGMKMEIARIRRAMGSLDEQIEKEKNPEKKAALQAKYNEQASKLERVYEESPRITTQLKAREQLDFEKAFDEAQAAEYDKAAAKRRGREKELAPALPRRKVGPLVADTRTRIKKQTGYKQTISEIADKALEDLVAARNAYTEAETRVNNRLLEEAAGFTDDLTAVARKARDQAQKDDIALMAQAEKDIRDAQKRMGQIAKQERDTYAELAKYRKGIPAEEEQRFARGVEVSSPDLTADQVRMLQKNDIVGALRSIAEDKNASKTNQVVAARLAAMLDATDVKLVKGLKDEKGQPALGRATSKLVELDANLGVSQEILLHEATHAAVERVLQMPEAQLTEAQRVARRELQALFNAVKNDPRITSVNAKGSLSEFAAEVMSNSNLQKQLSAKKWRLADAWQGFKSIIMRMLGIEKPETMLGAALQSVDALMIPSSMRVQGAARPKRVLSQKDIAALHTGSNSMRQFAEQFGPLIKQKDRTPEDAERIARGVFEEMYMAAEDYVAVPTENSLDYEGALVMPDGTKFDPANPLHIAEASIDTLAAYEAKSNSQLRKREAEQIKADRLRAFNKLTSYLHGNPSYTLVEQALVAKAASKYGVVSDRSGRLKLVNIDENNRHQIAVVGHDSANAIIEELRAGKPLKEAFLTGLQKMADANAQKNTALQGWAKFEQSDTEEAAKRLNAGAAGTPWCTGASVGTARRQISSGDFYIYYENGRPEVAVRMDGDNRIGEVRGNSANQSLSTKQQEIAEAFLRSKQDTFVGVDEYVNEVERRKALIAYLRSPSESTLRDLLPFISGKGEVRSYEIKSLFRFGRLDGYASLRPEPEAAAIEKLKDQINAERVKAVLDGDLSGMYASVIGSNTTDVTVSFGGETYKIPLNKIKRVKELTIYAANGREYDLSSLIEAKKLDFRADHKGYGKNTVAKTSVFQIPNLKNADLITWGSSHDVDSVPLTIVVPSDAKVDSVLPATDYGLLEIRGLTQARVVAAIPDLSSDKVTRLINEAQTPKSGNLLLPDLLYAQTEQGAYEPFYLTHLATNATNDALSLARKDNGITFTDLYSAEKFAEADPQKHQKVAESIDTVFAFVNKALGNKLKLPKGKTIVEKFIDDFNASEVFVADLYTAAEVDAAFNAYDAAHDETIQLAADGDVETAIEIAIDAGYLPDRRVTMTFNNIRGYIGSALYSGVANAYPDLDAETARKINEQVETAVLKDKAVRSEYMHLATNMYQTFMLDAPNRIADVPPAQAQQTELFPYEEPEEQPRYAKLNPELKSAVNVSEALIRREKSTMDKLRESGSGLAFETYVVDRFAGLEKMRKYMPEFKGMQMSFYLRMYDQRMNFVSQSVSNGALDLVAKKRKDGETEYLIESVKGPSVKSVVQILKGAKPMVGDVDAVNRLFTLYMTALRAEREGYKKLGLEQFATEQQIKDAVKDINSIPGLRDVFEEARQEYNTYNKNQITFLEKTGAISKQIADELRAKKDYIPWYRAGRDGSVEFMLGDEGIFTVGNLKEKPYLHELVGDNRPIFDFLTSSVQNTNMIVDMGLNNIATKNAVYELVGIGAAKITGKISGPDVVRFKDKGEDKYAVIETDAFGVPAELLVKGMEGIPRQVTGLMRMISLPSLLLRKAVTLSPLYVARQVFRDSLAAPILAGANFTPVAGALRQIGSPNKEILEQRGVVGGQYFTGTQEDLSMILREVMDGKSGLGTLIGKAEAFGMAADALTRRAQYESYIKQGMSEMEATLMSLESMNFNKRGAASYMHTANALIPFFNAQIQGLNVLYKALTGKMPLNDKLKIRQKLLMRGTMLMAGTLAYAALMEDDEAYKNALPDQKYGNWFVRFPGMEEPLKFPIPFEIGYIFKALPEALYNYIKSGDDDEAKAALNMILRQVVPGGSSMPVMEIGGIKLPVPIPVPQAAKPALEVALEKSFYTGRDLLSAREQRLLPEAQYRDQTTEISKALGKEFGISPVKVDALINGYTSTLGIAAVHLLGVGIPASDSPEKATKRWSEVPVVGSAFQPNDAGWAINRTYDLFKEDMKLQATVKEYIAKGERAKAAELIQQRSDQLMLAEVGNTFEQAMRKFTQYETAIKASDKSAEEKRRLLDEVRQTKIRYAEMVRQQTKAAKEAGERTTPQ